MENHNHWSLRGRPVNLFQRRRPRREGKHEAFSLRTAWVASRRLYKSQAKQYREPRHRFMWIRGNVDRNAASSACFTRPLYAWLEVKTPPHDGYKPHFTSFWSTEKLAVSSCLWKWPDCWYSRTLEIYRHARANTNFSCTKYISSSDAFIRNTFASKKTSLGRCCKGVETTKDERSILVCRICFDFESCFSCESRVDLL
jgi:hypothetical protein